MTWSDAAREAAALARQHHGAAPKITPRDLERHTKLVADAERAQAALRMHPMRAVGGRGGGDLAKDYRRVESQAIRAQKALNLFRNKKGL